MAGPNPVLISEIREYLDLMGIASQRARAKYLRLIQQLDSVYLLHAAEKQVQGANKTTKPTP